MPGKVLSVLVAAGQSVRRGQALAVMEAGMKALAIPHGPGALEAATAVIAEATGAGAAAP